MVLLTVRSFYPLLRSMREKAICGVGVKVFHNTNFAYQRFIINVAVLLK